MRGCKRKDGRKKRRGTYLGLAPVLIDQVQAAVYCEGVEEEGREGGGRRGKRRTPGPAGGLPVEEVQREEKRDTLRRRERRSLLLRPVGGERRGGYACGLSGERKRGFE